MCIKKKLMIIAIFILAVTGLTGCYDAKEIDDMAYVSAIGLDKGKTNELRMTLQIMNPNIIAGGAGEGGGGGGGETGKKSTSVTTVETPTIYSGFNMINNFISKGINLSHAKLVVFSEELAREGIHKYIHAMVRGREFRGNMYIVVSKCSAEEYLNNLEPGLEANPSKYIELHHGSFRYTSFTAETTLVDFYLQAECTCWQGVATLADIVKYSSSGDFTAENSTYEEKGREKPLEGDYTAGNIPEVGRAKTEIMGLAVFDGGKMIGNIDGQETTYYLMLIGDFQRAYVTLEDPLEKESYIVLDVRPRHMTKKDVNIIDGKPFCKAHVDLEADILSIQSGKNYEDPENIKLVEDSAKEFIKKGILRLLKKTTDEYNADIFAFGRSLKMKYLYWEEWMKEDWLNKYKNAAFSVEVSLKIRRPGLMIRTEPAYSTEGEVYK